MQVAAVTHAVPVAFTEKLLTVTAPDVASSVTQAPLTDAALAHVPAPMVMLPRVMVTWVAAQMLLVLHPVVDATSR